MSASSPPPGPASSSRAGRSARGAAATLHDVARAAGVSLATASRLLNGSERKVDESFRERVEAAAADLGYTANVSAQATARGTSPVIALLVADIADPYFGLIASGVARGADEHGLVVTIAITERDAEREARIVRALRGQRPQGLILAASRTEEPMEAETARELGEYTRLGGRTVTFGPDGLGDRRVEIDNCAGAEALGRRMAERGYRTAIAIGAAEGVRTMSAIRDAGRQPGVDIAVCGFDDVPSSSDVTPALTTVRVPLSEVGYQAFRATVDPDWQQPPLPLEVIMRASTPEVAA